MGPQRLGAGGSGQASRQRPAEQTGATGGWPGLDGNPAGSSVGQAAGYGGLQSGTQMAPPPAAVAFASPWGHTVSRKGSS